MTFVLTTYNVRYFSQASHGLHAARHTMHALARALAETEPDIVALQEVEAESLRGGFGAGSQLARFADAFREATRDDGWQGIHVPVHRYGVGPVALYTTGLGLLVSRRFRVLGVASTDVTHVRWPVARALKQRRRVMVAHLASPDGRTWSIANVHLSLPAFFEGSLFQVIDRMGSGSNQLIEAEQLVTALADAPSPTVLCGDLNAAPTSPVVRRLTDEGWRLHSGALPATATFFEHTMAIDHIFARPRIRVSAVRAPSVRDPVWSRLSDHVPVSATITLPEPEATPWCPTTDTIRPSR